MSNATLLNLETSLLITLTDRKGENLQRKAEMRLELPLFFLSLAATGSADSMSTREECFTFFCKKKGWFKTSSGEHEIDVKDGCHTTGVPGMIAFCIDWRSKRAHFQFDQQYKRCLLRRGTEPCPYIKGMSCNTAFWEEVPCSWREAWGESATNVTEGSREV